MLNKKLRKDVAHKTQCFLYLKVKLVNNDSGILKTGLIEVYSKFKLKNIYCKVKLYVKFKYISKKVL